MSNEREFDIREALPESSYDINEILPQVEEELRRRLDATLSAKDGLAVRTALLKAAVRGFARGVSQQVDQMNKVLDADPGARIERVDAEFPDLGNEQDLWAERYRAD
jgi:hypothetical protein